jgi:hypothetical protein
MIAVVQAEIGAARAAAIAEVAAERNVASKKARI